MTKDFVLKPVYARVEQQSWYDWIQVIRMEVPPPNTYPFEPNILQPPYLHN